MKKYITLLFSIGLIMSSYAQIGEASDPLATKVLDKLKRKYDSFTSLEADFTLEMKLSGQDTETQNGKIIQDGEMYLLSLADQVIYNNGTYVWIHLKSNKEVQLSDADFEEESEIMSPKDMLRIYESNEYIYAITDVRTENGKKLTEIEFKPLDRDSEYIKMRISINRKDNIMKKIAIFVRDGSKYTVSLENIESNKTYDEKIFAFDKAAHPGVHVEDLRID